MVEEYLPCKPVGRLEGGGGERERGVPALGRGRSQSLYPTKLVVTVIVTSQSPVSLTGWHSAGCLVNDMGLCFLSGSSPPGPAAKESSTIAAI